MQASSAHPPADSQGFNIDSFDFGADFSLPSSLDELSIFTNSALSQQGHSEASQAVNDHSVASPSGATNLKGKKRGAPANIDHSHDGSPRPTSQFSSPNGTGKDRVASPRGRQTSNGPSRTTADSTSNSPHSTMQNLHSLLNSINTSAASQQQYQQQLKDSNLSISEMEKLLSEKEEMERAQSIQTAFLRQQLEALQKQSSVASAFRNPEANDLSHMPNTTAAMSATQLMHQFQQLQSQQQAGNNPATHNFNTAVPPGSATQVQTTSFGKPGPSTSVNPYGLITPAPSGAFSQMHRTQMPFVSPLNMAGTDQSRIMDASTALNGAFTPLESPAITPASVFSNMSNSSTSAELFSPLTSPALHPQTHPHVDAIAMQLSPFHGPIKPRPKARGASGSSPATLTGTKSVPRKNRSTTAEARANRARASPLVKPTIPASTPTPAQQLRRTADLALGGVAAGTTGTGSAQGSRSLSRSTSQSEQIDGKQTPQAFPPLSAGSGSTKPMDASPSEAAASTPSPIEMPPPNGKPMTPSTIMGLRAQSKSSKSDKGDIKNTADEHSSKLSQVDDDAGGASTNGKSVSFAQSPSGGLQTILPGGLSNQDREAWIASMKSAGGLESRRTSHKAAEQKRRDSLKYCFDELRGMLPAITLDDDVPGGSMLGPDGLLEDQNYEGFSIDEVGDAESARIANRAISKVALLRHSNEYLIRLKHRMGRRERDLAICRREIMDLRARLNMPVPPELPALTLNMAQSAASAGYNMNGIMTMDGFNVDQSDPQQVALFAAIQQHLQSTSGEHHHHHHHQQDAHHQHHPLVGMPHAGPINEFHAAGIGEPQSQQQRQGVGGASMDTS